MKTILMGMTAIAAAILMMGHQVQAGYCGEGGGSVDIGGIISGALNAASEASKNNQPEPNYTPTYQPADDQDFSRIENFARPSHLRSAPTQPVQNVTPTHISTTTYGPTTNSTSSVPITSTTINVTPAYSQPTNNTTTTIYQNPQNPNDEDWRTINKFLNPLRNYDSD